MSSVCLHRILMQFSHTLFFLKLKSNLTLSRLIFSWFRKKVKNAADTAILFIFVYPEKNVYFIFIVAVKETMIYSLTAVANVSIPVFFPNLSHFICFTKPKTINIYATFFHYLFRHFTVKMLR